MPDFSTAFSEAWNAPVNMNGPQNLQGNKIHNVKLTSCREEIIKGKKDDKEYDCLIFEFTEVGEDGNVIEGGRKFTDKTFPITAESMENRTWTNGQRTVVFPSTFQTVMLKFRCYMDQICPNTYEKIQKGEIPFVPNSWADCKKFLLNLFTQVLKSDKNPVLKLKLVKDKNGYATLPNFINLTKDGKGFYLSNAFIGNVNLTGAKHREIAFTDYELKQIQREEQAKNNVSTTKELLGSENELMGNVTSGDLKNLDGVEFNDDF